MIHFASIWNKLLKHCVYVDILLMESYAQGALRKELRVDPFVEPLKQLL